ncbi:GroES-like protein [Paraphaeosphaeria sporulosa]|uniref:GroES-like protein n=1 Tax=Paraphaeosphaeria sporulosa TaxID=1460663 RepID=A0A177CA27_9PLEO|nr:GroES-like protein [Paraphaeosphaeria sporulosa]OAG03580.1 GroES-like protein [Paraphaeosphaeria sporulosa]
MAHPVRAWTFTNGYPSTLRLSTIPIPQENDVQPTHMLVKIAACALNPVDIQIMNLPHFSLPTLNGEKTTVMDFAGTVVAGGGAQFSKGDKVFGMAFASYAPAGGALAEYAHFPLATTVAVKKPRAWPVDKAAAISLVWLTAKACVEAVAPWVEATASKRVAVLGGSSATGMYITMLVKRRGWKVVATSSARNRGFVVDELKADAHVDYTSEHVRTAVGKFEPDAVVDCVGGTECIGLPSSKRYVTIVGDKTGRTMMGGPATYYDMMHPVHAAAQWVRWAKGKYGLGESYDVVILDQKSEWLEEAKETLSPEDIYIDSVYEFEDAKQAFERLNTGRAKGKVVIRIGERSST